MTVAEPVSLRQAAKSVGVAPSTLSALLKVEPTLQAALVGRGARGSMKIALDQLTAAWDALQREPGQEPQNDRQRYRLERCRNLWFQVAGERARLAETEAALVSAADLEVRWPAVLAALRDAALAWVETAAAVAPGLPAAEAQIELQELTHSALLRLVAEHSSDATEATPAPVSLVFPAHDPPSLWSLRGDLEAVRAEARRVALLVQRGELVEVAAAKARVFDEARRLRDGWLRAGESLGLRAPALKDADDFKAAAIQELSRAGLVA
jgi:hypothetical protein